jgi:hypothetical protein
MSTKPEVPCPNCGHSPTYKEDPKDEQPTTHFCHACSKGFNVTEKPSPDWIANAAREAAEEIFGPFRSQQQADEYPAVIRAKAIITAAFERNAKL